MGFRRYARTLVWLGLVVAMVAPAEAAAVSGPSARSSIAGGYFPSDSAWPWTTALLDLTKAGNDFDRNSCTAVLISPRRVLTAAHCVVQDDDSGTTRPGTDFQVAIGRRNLLDTSQGERRNVTTITLHPKLYLPNSGIHQNHAFHDVAVLFLSRPSSIPPAPIGEEGDGDFGSGSATAMGWGHYNYDHEHPSFRPELKAADFTLYDDSQCSYYMDEASTRHYYPSIHVCVGEQSDGTLDCITHGDSGGPLMVYSRDAWRLIGITSFFPHGSGGCSAGPPFGFAWVAGPTLRPWPLSVRDPMRISRRQIRRYIRRMIRRKTNGRIRHLRSRCRRGYSAARCTLRWRIGRRGYRGKARFSHRAGGDNRVRWRFSFRGRRSPGSRRLRW